MESDQAALTGIVNRRQGAALPERPRVYHRDALVSELKRRAQSFVTFIGFGELGYEDEPVALTLDERRLSAQGKTGEPRRPTARR